jgi:hypothetical protein
LAQQSEEPSEDPALDYSRRYVPRIDPFSEAQAAAHLKAVRAIAEARFGFPTDRYRDYKTYLNVPTRSIGVGMPYGGVAYPDIVVVQEPENQAKILGQVEIAEALTNETVTKRVARRRWRPFANLAPLYLFVPVGQGDEAKYLCRYLHVPVVGIRTWRYAVGAEQIEINDLHTEPSGPEDLLPKALRPTWQT